MTEVALIFVISAAGTGGELCVARAMKARGRGGRFPAVRPPARASGALGIRWLWLGVALMVVSFLALLAMLSVENVSFVIPLTALSYVIGALGGTFFLGERVDPQRWIGVLLVCTGVALVFVGGR